MIRSASLREPSSRKGPNQLNLLGLSEIEGGPIQRSLPRKQRTHAIPHNSWNSRSEPLYVIATKTLHHQRLENYAALRRSGDRTGRRFYS